MNPLVVLQDIQSLLTQTSISDEAVVRDSTLYTDMKSHRQTGFIVWDFNIDWSEESSEGYSLTFEGDLDIVIYSTSRTVRQNLMGELFDILTPLTNGKRVPYQQKNLANSFLHFCQWTRGVEELFSEKTGHSGTETPGIMLTCRLKFSIWE